MKQITFDSGGNAMSVTAPQFFEMFRNLLYDGESQRQVPELLSEISLDDNQQLGKLYKKINYDDILFLAALCSIICAEDTPFISEDQVGPLPEGTLAGDYRIRQRQEACKLWLVPKRAAIGTPSNILCYGRPV